jgi:hypothetical protein
MEKFDIAGQMSDWIRSLTILHRGHWEAARFFDMVNLLLGIGTTITAAASGTAVFTQLSGQMEKQQVSLGVQIAIGAFSFLAAAMAALQAFFKSSELAARHKQWGVKFGQLRRELEQYRSTGLSDHVQKATELLSDFRKRWDAVEDEALPLPQWIFKREESKFAKRGGTRGTRREASMS